MNKTWQANRPLSKINKPFALFWSSVLVLASTRGALVYHLGLSPNTTYATSAILLVCFGLVSSWNTLHNLTDKSLVRLKNAIKINFYLLGIYSIAQVSLLGVSEISTVYSFVIFPIIFTLVKYDKVLLERIVHIITVITISGVYYFYWIINTGGYYEIIAANQILRSGEESISRIGDYLLPGGYLGSHHDAANILVMCSVFYFSKMINTRSFSQLLYIGLFCLCAYITLLTGSATNIAVLIMVISISVMVHTKDMPRKTTVILFTLCGLLLIFFFNESISDKLYFREKFTSQNVLEGGGIYNALNLDSIFKSLFSILFGFGYVMEVPMIYSEIAFIKLLVGYGLMPFLILMFIIFSPVYYIYVFRKNVNNQARAINISNSAFSISNFTRIERTYQRQLSISVMPVLCGALTLLHYGSLFRVTSIGLLCVFMALFYKEYIYVTKTIKQ